MLNRRQRLTQARPATRRRLLPTTALICACLALSACGSSHKAKQASATTQAKAAGAVQESEQVKALKESTSGLAVPTGNLTPGTVLAHVGSVAITFATVQHRMVLRSPQTPLPDPPSYAACIARLKAPAPAPAGSSSASGQSEAQLKQNCQHSYEQLLQSGLSSAIHTQWLIGEAAEEGASVSQSAVHQEFNLSKKQFRSEAEFATYRKSTGQTIADMMGEIKLGKLTDKLFENIKKKEHPATSAEVAAYYQAHRQKYAIPQGRDVRIVRTTTQAAALRAKQELQSGKSFASVAKELSAIGQPLTASNGEVPDLLPNLFAEKKLNDAIFAAQLHRLYGPLQLTAAHKTIAPETNSGFFVFEVIKTVPGRQIALATVKATIAQELTKAQKEKTLAAAVAAFKSKWRAKTDCQPGFVVKNCRQYKASELGIVGDPYTL